MEDFFSLIYKDLFPELTHSSSESNLQSSSESKSDDIAGIDYIERKESFVVEKPAQKYVIRVKADMAKGFQGPDDGCPDDGYTWRKYGQKDILCFKYPRSYYRCAVRGCPAKKHTQWDDGGSLFEIVYNQRHNSHGNLAKQQQQQQEHLRLLENEFISSHPKQDKSSGNRLLGRPHMPVKHFLMLPQDLFKLTVLDLSHTKIEHLPEALSHLKNLQKLLFSGCARLKMIPSLAKLEELRILDLSYTIIKELPQGIDQLVNLRCLNLNHTKHLKTFPAGVLCKLSVLEDLFMFESRYSWSSNLSDILKGADIEEIITAGSLANLALCFMDLPSFTKYMGSGQWKCLKSFCFDIGKVSYSLPLISFRWEYAIQIQGCDLTDHKNSLVLPENTLELVAKNCYSISCLSELQCFSNLKNLKLCGVVDCSEMRYICKAINGALLLNVALLTLEELILYNLPNLMALCKGVPLHVYPATIKSLTVERCPNLKILFSVSTILHLQNLEYIRLWMCDKMEDIVGEDEETVIVDDSSAITLSNLKELQLGCLWGLRNISKRTLVCNSLVIIVVQNCPNLKKLPLWRDGPPTSLEMIKGSRKWWNSLEQDDFNVDLMKDIYIEQSDFECSESGGEEDDDDDEDDNDYAGDATADAVSEVSPRKRMGVEVDEASPSKRRGCIFDPSKRRKTGE